VFKLHVLYVRLVGFYNHKFTLDVILTGRQKFSVTILMYKVQFRAYKSKETD
jgi:hypothetical protein